MKKIQSDIQNFEEIITGGFLYIDKTEYIYRLITQGRHYFLAHPRRFGKSLLISTLECIFQGKKELFTDLWISKSDYAWPTHPVITLDFSAYPRQTVEIFDRSLTQELIRIGQRYGIHHLEQFSSTETLKDLCFKLNQHYGLIVLLIDEYDKPILDSIAHVDNARAIITYIQDFMTVVKSLSRSLTFVFITGISRFSKTSVFTGDNLKDMSKNDQYDALLGITDQEIDRYLTPHIALFAAKKNKTITEIRESIRLWYNGYRFSKRALKVYNPFSVLNALADTAFNNYWFTSGSPSYLVSLIKDRYYTFDDFAITDFDHLSVSSDVFETFSLDTLSMIAVLIQAGYLTIKDYKKVPLFPPEYTQNPLQIPLKEEYILGHPNEELKDSFNKLFLQDVMGISQKKTETAIFQLHQAFNKNDMTLLYTTLHWLFASITYDIQMPQEKHYQLILSIISLLVSKNTEIERHTNLGRIDLVIETSQYIYIVEIKINKNAQIALQQIKDNHYADAFIIKNKKIVLVGISFDTSVRNIQEIVSEDFYL